MIAIVAPPEQRRKPLSPEMRAACRFLDRHTQKLMLVSHFNLKIDEDVKAFMAVANAKLEELCKKRGKLYDKITRSETPEKKAAIRLESSGYTEDIIAIRKTTSNGTTHS